MKKIIAPKANVVSVIDVPEPEMGPRDVMVRSVRSLISPGSELKRVVPVEGEVRQGWPNHDLGYAICGEIIAKGPEVEGFEIGDRVATMENHQEIVVSPTAPGTVHPTVRIPDGISWDDAPFILWGRSCWNWTRKADIQVGESVAVMGLGLVGLLMTMWSRLRAPGLVIGLSYIFFFNAPSFDLFGMNVPNPANALYGTMAILVLSNVVHFFTVGYLTATTALGQLDREFEAVSESMGVPFYRTFLRVTAPVCLPAILEIGLYFFVNSMATVSAVIFLYSADIPLAAVAVANMDDAGDIAPACAMSVLIVAANVAVRILYGLATKRLRRRSQAWAGKG